MNTRRMVFITGASRSGTTLLSFVLRNHPEVFGLRELQYFGEAWDPRSPDRQLTRHAAVEAAARMLARQEQGILAYTVEDRHRREAGMILDSVGEAGTDAAEVFATVAVHLAVAGGKTIPCEQTPRYVFYARALLDLYPQAHVVHIVRDPRAVMASQKRRWRRRHLATNGHAFPRYQSLRVWVNYHPYTVARLWSRATSAALAASDHPRVTLVRFEDLLREPEQTVRTLCERLGLDYDPGLLDVGQINSSHQSSAGGARRGLQAEAIDKWREVLSPAEVAVTERLCGSLMRRFDYGTEAGAGTTLLQDTGYGLSYLAHLAGVALVNPGRAYVQGRALLHLAARRPSAPSARTYAK
jgi:omega-hydroxy-beta-dihydromenaquinone-9 sulfotransferase